MRRSAPGRRRRSRTSSRRQHLVGLVGSAVLAVTAVVLIGVGGYAWSMDRPDRVAVQGNVGTELQRTPWFDAGTTLFSSPIGSERGPQPLPVEWSCSLTTEDQVTELTRRPDRDLVGTRVIDGISVVPVVTIGALPGTAELLCTGEITAGSTAMWVLPTNPGAPRVPLSIIVGGIALGGLAAVLHPRGRGLQPFGR